jgi:hypothetical protein
MIHHTKLHLEKYKETVDYVAVTRKKQWKEAEVMKINPQGSWGWHPIDAPADEYLPLPGLLLEPSHHHGSDIFTIHTHEQLSVRAHTVIPSGFCTFCLTNMRLGNQ